MVESAHPVRGQEQDALLVLEQPDEDAYHRVALDVTLRALLHEDVRFVQQQHSVPHLADFEDGFQFRLQLCRVCPELADVDHVQGFVQGLGRCLRGQRLADAGRAVQQEDEAVALTLDNVGVDPPVVVDQQLQILFLRFVHHNPVYTV